MAQRRVAGATALMIMLYLLQVTLFAPSAAAAVSDPITPDTFPVGPNGTTDNCPKGGDWSDHQGTEDEAGAWGSATGVLQGSVTVTVNEGYVVYICLKSGDQREIFEVTHETGPQVVAPTVPHGLSNWSVTSVEVPTFDGALTVVKDVVVVSGTPSTTDFDFIVTGQTDFSLADGEASSAFTYSLTDALDTEVVTITEGLIVEAGWSTSIACDDTALTSSANSTVDVTVGDGDDITCTVTNTYEPVEPGEGSIDVTKTANPTQVVAPGANVVFSVTVENTSDVEVEITSLDDDQYGDIADDGNALLVSTTCAVPQTLAANGDTYSCQFTALVDGDAGTTHTNVVMASGEDEFENPVSDDDDAVVTIVAPTDTTITTDTTLATNTTVTENTLPFDETEVAGVTVTTAPTEVAGVTVTAAPGEVAADTLPFTGFGSGYTVTLGLLALLAGALVLIAVRGRKDEETIGPDMGSWTNL
jgi:hypothetical protein